MLYLVKIVTITVCFPGISLAFLADTSLSDETSFLQVQQTLKHGGDHPGPDGNKVEARPQVLLAKDTVKEIISSKTITTEKQAADDLKDKYKPLPGTNRVQGFVEDEPDEAGSAHELDSQRLDEGLKNAHEANFAKNAYEANFAKAKAQALAAADQQFHKKVQLEALSSHREEESILTREQSEVARRLKQDKDAVDHAYERRLAVQNRALQKVTEAQEAYEARALKQAQAEKAAAEGQWQGVRAGQEEIEDRFFEWQKAEGEAAARKAAAEHNAWVNTQLSQERAALGHLADMKAMANQAYTSAKIPEDSGWMRDRFIANQADRYATLMGRAANEAHLRTRAAVWPYGAAYPYGSAWP